MEFHHENRNNEIHLSQASVKDKMRTFSSPVTVQSVYESRVVCPGVGGRLLEEAE